MTCYQVVSVSSNLGAPEQHLAGWRAGCRFSRRHFYPSRSRSAATPAHAHAHAAREPGQTAVLRGSFSCITVQACSRVALERGNAGRHGKPRQPYGAETGTIGRPLRNDTNDLLTIASTFSAAATSIDQSYRRENPAADTTLLLASPSKSDSHPTKSCKPSQAKPSFLGTAPRRRDADEA